MEFTNTFHIPLPIDQAWKLMLDVPRILPCLPGAKLTEGYEDTMPPYTDFTKEQLESMVDYMKSLVKD